MISDSGTREKAGLKPIQLGTMQGREAKHNGGCGRGIVMSPTGSIFSPLNGKCGHKALEKKITTESLGTTLSFCNIKKMALHIVENVYNGSVV